MVAKGKNYLMFAGLFEILVGAATFILTFAMLQNGTGGISPTEAQGASALWTLVIIYATAGFQLVAGIIAVVLANKPKNYKVCYVISALLIVCAYGNFTSDISLQNFIFNTISLLGPAYYFYGALLNKKSL